MCKGWVLRALSFWGYCGKVGFSLEISEFLKGKRSFLTTNEIRRQNPPRERRKVKCSESSVPKEKEREEMQEEAAQEDR